MTIKSLTFFAVIGIPTISPKPIVEITENNTVIYEKSYEFPA